MAESVAAVDWEQLEVVSAAVAVVAVVEAVAAELVGEAPAAVLSLEFVLGTEGPAVVVDLVQKLEEFDPFLAAVAAVVEQCAVVEHPAAAVAAVQVVFYLPQTSVEVDLEAPGFAFAEDPVVESYQLVLVVAAQLEILVV